ncbi:MAG: hypothetical protein AAFX51_10565 [Cyanobacteria bacterium J06636_28]
MYNRRRFLLLSSLALGACSARPITQSATTADPPSSPAVPSVSPAPKRHPNVGKAIGPEELFAPKRGDVRAVVISDMNSRYGAVDYRQEVMKGVSILPQWEPDIVLCVGDMVAGQSISLTTPEVEAMWAGFDNLILKPIREATLPLGLARRIVVATG